MSKNHPSRIKYHNSPIATLLNFLLRVDILPRYPGPHPDSILVTYEVRHAEIKAYYGHGCSGALTCIVACHEK